MGDDSIEIEKEKDILVFQSKESKQSDQDKKESTNIHTMDESIQHSAPLSNHPKSLKVNGLFY